MITNWKKQLPENGTELFDRGKKREKESKDHERQIGELHKAIGQLTVERDFLKKILSDIRERAGAVEPAHKSLSVKRQCELPDVNRSSVYYRAKVQEETKVREIKDMERILRQWHECPFYGYRRIHARGIEMGKKRVRRLMEKMELHALYPKPRTTKPAEEHKKHTYLLRNKEICYPNQVRASYITYLKLEGGSHVYPVVILDLYSGKELSWSLNNMMDRYFCIEALNRAINRYGVPAIFNSDQGSRFTGDEFTGTLRKHGVEISMNGKGQALDGNSGH